MRGVLGFRDMDDDSLSQASLLRSSRSLSPACSWGLHAKPAAPVGTKKKQPTERLLFLGSGTWIRTMIKGFRVPRPAVRRSRNISLEDRHLVHFGSSSLRPAHRTCSVRLAGPRSCGTKLASNDDLPRFSIQSFYRLSL